MTTVPAFPPLQHTLAAAAARGEVVMVGLGAIGSPAADAVARAPGLRGAVLIDPDRVEEKNLLSQHVVPTDVQHAKTSVHRRRMQRIRPELPVQTWQRRVQSVPLGVLRGRIVLSAPDNRETRRYLGMVCWATRAVLLDAGVEPTGELLRVTGYAPAADSACPACLFSDEDYRTLEQRYPCAAETAAAAPTNTRFSLALTAAGHLVVELDKVLAGAHEHLLVNRQLVIDCRHHRHFVTVLRRNPACREPHTPPWPIIDIAHTPDALTLEQLFAALDARSNVAALRVPTTAFVTRLTCRACGGQRPLLRLANRLRPAEQRCRACGGELLAAGFDLQAALTAAALPGPARERPLSTLGLERADIAAVVDGERTHYVQLGRVHHEPHHQEDSRHA